MPEQLPGPSGQLIHKRRGYYGRIRKTVDGKEISVMVYLSSDKRVAEQKLATMVAAEATPEG